MSLTDLGEIIKRIRSMEKLTQAKLAELLGVSQGLIVKYESGESKPGLEIIKTFKKKLGYDLTADNITKVVEPVQAELNQQDMNTDMESRRTLERTLENMSEDKIRSTAIIERLVALLERSINSDPPGKSDPVHGLKDKPAGTAAAREDHALRKRYSPLNKPAKKNK